MIWVEGVYDFYPRISFRDDSPDDSLLFEMMRWSNYANNLLDGIFVGKKCFYVQDQVALYGMNECGIYAGGYHFNTK